MEFLYAPFACVLMAHPEGFEPSTNGIGIRYSIRAELRMELLYYIMFFSQCQVNKLFFEKDLIFLFLYDRIYKLSVTVLRRCVGIGRRGGLKIRWANNPCGFDPRHRHHTLKARKPLIRPGLRAFLYAPCAYLRFLPHHQICRLRAGFVRRCQKISIILPAKRPTPKSRSC